MKCCRLPMLRRTLAPRLFTAMFWVAVYGALLSARPAWSGETAKPATAEELTEKRAKLAEQIAKLHAAEEAAKNDEAAAAAAPESSDDELDLLESLDLIYGQQQATLEQRAELEKDKKAIQDETDALHKFGPAEPKPYSFLLLEDLRDQLSAEEDRSAAYAAELNAAGQMLEAARESYDECERERRQAREGLDEEKDPAQHAKLSRELELAELNSQLAQETVNLRRAEIEVKTARQELSKLREDFLREKQVPIAKDARFTERDYHSRVERLTKTRDGFQRKLKRAERQLRQHESQQLKSVAKLQEEKADKAVVAAASEAFQVARRVHFEEIALLNQRLGEVDRLKHFLNCRFEMATGKATHDDMKEWASQLEDAVERLKATEQSIDLRLEEIRADQATLYGRAQAGDSDNQALMPWVNLQTEQLSELAELCESSIPQLRSNRRLLQRFHDDLDAATEVDGGPSRWTRFTEAVGVFWNYELASVNDRPITIGKIVSGLLYFFVGVLLSRVLSQLIGRHVLPRFGLNEGAIHAIQSISFYSLCVVFSLLSLELVNLPFAAFTFLGGAVAIGIGFGSQNIMNNFISGLILLAEQPIRVGDRVQIDGTAGTVEHIGARSTRVRTIANHEIIVPNSQLLENKVTNLTLSDDLVRTAIGVSMSPSLPIDDVIGRLRDAALSHPLVLADPAPVVLFLSFSDTLLSFELHFWIRLHTLMDCRIVESEVRAAISSALRNTDASTTRISPLTSPVAAETKPAGEMIAAKLPDATKAAEVARLLRRAS